MKKAIDFVTELANAVLWLEPASIVLAEVRHDRTVVNWSATVSPVLAATQNEFDLVVSRWRDAGLQLDWEGAEFKEDRRVVVKWMLPRSEGTSLRLSSAVIADLIRNVCDPDA